MKRDAVYARYSSHNQHDNTSIEVQLEACRRICGPQPLEYIDRGVTGTVMERDGFRAMLDDAEAGRIGKLYVYKFDRFGRSAHAHAVVADLEDMGVRVVSATEGHDPLSRGIQLVVAEDFSRKLSDRVAEAKLRRFQQGYWHGGTPPYGYQAEHKRLVINPDEAEVIRIIFETFITQNIGAKQIAIDLNHRGFRPRRARMWFGGSVSSILRNEVYRGAVWNRRHPSAAGKRRRGEPTDAGEQVRHDESLRIISDETFERVQEKIAQRGSLRPRGRNVTRVFSRLIRCGVCGSTCVRRFSARKEKEARWACGIRVRQTRDLCSNHIHRLESEMLREIQATFAQVFDASEQMIEEATGRARAILSEGQGQAADLGRRIAECDRRLDRLMDRVTDPDLDDAATKKLISQHIARETQQKEAIERQQGEVLSTSTLDEDRLVRSTRQAFDEARDLLSSVMPHPELNQFLQDYVGPMVLQPDGQLVPDTSACAPEGKSPRRFEPRDILRTAFWVVWQAA